MKTAFFAAVITLLAVQGSFAASLAWTGLIDNQWTNAKNWNPANVPQDTDDVEISVGNVQVTVPVAINSLVMGDSVDGTASLTLFNAFAVSKTAAVKLNGNVVVDSGSNAVTGTFNVDGSLTMKSGFLSGAWTVSSKGTASFPGGAARSLTGGSLSVAGKMSLTGVFNLSSQAQFLVTGALTSNGDLQLMGDSSTSVDVSQGTFAYGGGNLTILSGGASFGALTFTSGNILIYTSATFTQPIALPSGGSISTNGAATVSFPSLTGPGNVFAQGASTTFSTLDVASLSSNGPKTLLQSSATIGTFTVLGGQVTLSGPVKSQNLGLRSGILQGGSNTAVSVQNAVTFGGLGMSVNTSVVFGTSASVVAPSLVILGSLGSFAISNKATISVTSPFNVTGSGKTSGITSDAAMTVSSAMFLQNADFVGAGSVQITSGSVNVRTARFFQGNATLSTGTSVTGFLAGLQFTQVSAAPQTNSVQVTVGSYTFTCKDSCYGVQTTTPSADHVSITSLSQ